MDLDADAIADRRGAMAEVDGDVLVAGDRGHEAPLGVGREFVVGAGRDGVTRDGVLDDGDIERLGTALEGALR